MLVLVLLDKMVGYTRHARLIAVHLRLKEGGGIVAATTDLAVLSETRGSQPAHGDASVAVNNRDCDSSSRN